ncbi:MAG TPA: hypothetical protein VND42_06065 [Candidatus Acidoferrales bacterium]|nr:hypothetical protein [Candidatus Acidoferrales bacterium]
MRIPLVVAGAALLVGVFGAVRYAGKRAFLAIALMRVIFLHAKAEGSLS